MDCDFTVRAKTEEELMRECREHACSAHGKCSTSPGAEAKMRSRIRDVWS
jgi:predicted small metal-binding protein